MFRYWINNTKDPADFDICAQESNETLRNKTALLMRTKKEEFMPFLTNAKTGNPFTPGTHVEVIVGFYIK